MNDTKTVSLDKDILDNFNDAFAKFVAVVASQADMAHDPTPNFESIIGGAFRAAKWGANKLEEFLHSIEEEWNIKLDFVAEEEGE